MIQKPRAPAVRHPTNHPSTCQRPKHATRTSTPGTMREPANTLTYIYTALRLYVDSTKPLTRTTGTIPVRTVPVLYQYYQYYILVLVPVPVLPVLTYWYLYYILVPVPV